MLALYDLFCSEVTDAGTETHANLNQELYYHFLGTDQSQDILCWKDPENPKHSFSADVTEDGKVIANCYNVNSVMALVKWQCWSYLI